MQTDFLVIGSGISGLNFALNAAHKGKVIIATKKKLIDANTNFAQGGIAAVLDRTDSPEELIADTLKTGAHHNNKKAVEFLARNSADAIYHLIELGMQFEKEKGKLKLAREGGHGRRRIVYSSDKTGKEIEKILIRRVKEHPNISILENTFALDLLVNGKKCYGATFLQSKKILQIFAGQTILATGGIGQLYKFTTNPSIATGDGIAIALRAGCRVRDLEFIQFHPTALAKKLSPMFLISETLRGEGAKILNSKGERFIDELAGRDEVARAIFQQTTSTPANTSTSTVFLDITHKPRTYLKKRFPQIYERLRKYGYDLAKDRIPITPAAHYICGGVVTDLHGRTNIRNLFAFGEVACTGVHGANRLASNSLLEALVFSNQIIKKLAKSPIKIPAQLLQTNPYLTSLSAFNSHASSHKKSVTGDNFFRQSKTTTQNSKKGNFFTGEKFKNSPQFTNASQLSFASQLINASQQLTRKLSKTDQIRIRKFRKEIQETMWTYGGIIRSPKLITEEALPILTEISQQLEKIPGTTRELAETRNMAITGLGILQSASNRPKSLGCHFVA